MTPNPKTYMIFVAARSCLCKIHRIEVYNRHQTMLDVYANKFGKSSVAWRHALQSIWPIGIALEYVVSLSCKQRAEHFTRIMWFYFIKWRFHFIRGRFHNSWVHQILSKIFDTKPNFIWKLLLIHVRKNIGFTQMTSQWGVEDPNILLTLAPMCFLWNNLWSVCRCITGPVSGCSSQVGMGWSTTFNRSTWKSMSGIDDHRVTFLMDLLSYYTFYTNLTLDILHKSDNLLQ